MSRIFGVAQKCLKDFLTYSKKFALLLICQLGLRP